MEAIVNPGPGRLELLDWPLPQSATGQVRVRTGACSVCATDLKMIAGRERTSFPSIHLPSQPIGRRLSAA